MGKINAKKEDKEEDNQDKDLDEKEKEPNKVELTHNDRGICSEFYYFA